MIGRTRHLRRLMSAVMTVPNQRSSPLHPNSYVFGYVATANGLSFLVRPLWPPLLGLLSRLAASVGAELLCGRVVIPTS